MGTAMYFQAKVSRVCCRLREQTFLPDVLRVDCASRRRGSRTFQIRVSV
jgi:hypothetical protein